MDTLASRDRLDGLLWWTSRVGLLIAIVTLLFWAVSLWRMPRLPLGGGYHGVIVPRNALVLDAMNEIYIASHVRPADHWDASVQVIKLRSISVMGPIRVGGIDFVFRCRTIVGILSAIATGCIFARRYRRRPTRGFVVAPSVGAPLAQEMRKDF